MADRLREKLARLRDGGHPRVLDLFTGCGGISLGFELAGATLIGGVEIDPTAVKTYARNFHGEQGSEALDLHSQPRDICREDPHRLVKDLTGARASTRQVDIIVGGPPCQAFARIGRAKLREIAKHSEAFLKDERAELYRHYLHFIKALRPVAVVIENVPDVLNYGGVNVFEVISEALEIAGYEVRYGLLNSVHYGVPQMRDRCFLIAVSRVASIEPMLPPPTRHWTLPQGYQGTRDVALKATAPLVDSHYAETPRPSTDLPRAVTASEALCDLPRIKDHLRGKLKKAPRRLDEKIKLLPAPEGNDYVRLMRAWPGFESGGFVYDHAIRYLPRDYRIFRLMKPGDQYPEAHELATRLRDEELSRLQSEKGAPPSAEDEARITAQFVPPYDPGKFPNKWRKMEADAPSRTLTAHIGKDTYSHIHYDSDQSRTISVREAARLQSFPDGFRFAGTMNPAFRQIGNSVPPLLAHAVAAQLVATLRNDCEFYLNHMFKLHIMSRGPADELVENRC